MINDLTVGNPIKLIIKFALPLLIGNLFMQLYQISDMIIVGRMINVDALAAIGVSLFFGGVGVESDFDFGPDNHVDAAVAHNQHSGTDF